MDKPNRPVAVNGTFVFLYLLPFPGTMPKGKNDLQDRLFLQFYWQECLPAIQRL